MAGAPDAGAAPGAGRRAQPRGLATRCRLLAAAEELFGARGFEGTSVVQIAERAGVGVGTLYHHFPDKRAVLLELVESWADDLVAERSAATLPRAEAAIDESGERAVLEAWLRATLDRLHKSPSLWPVVADLAGRDPQVREQLVRVRRAGAVWLHALFERLQERGAIRRDVDTTAAAWLVRAALDRVARQYVIDGVSEPTSDRMIQELVKMICRYLLVEDAP